MPGKQDDNNPEWQPVYATVVRRTSVISEAEDRLPVYCITFTMHQEMLDTPLRDHRMDLGDYVKIVRPGNPCTSYSISARRADEFDVTFKVYSGGKCSNFLKSVAPGTEVPIFARISRTVRNPGAYVGIVAFGVGITEALPVAQGELEKDDAKHVRLLWALRTKAETFWAERIATLQNAHGARFSMVYMLSLEDRAGCLHGRVNAQVLAEVFKNDSGQDARFLSVGTSQMMNQCDAMFHDARYPQPEQALFPQTNAEKALLFRTDNP